MMTLFHSQTKDLRFLNWPEKLTVLVLAPHPDDFDAIGVTLKFLHEKNYTIYVAVSITGSGIDPDFAPNMSLQTKREIRMKEQKDSVSFFGLEEKHLRFLTLKNAADDQLTGDTENVQMISDLIHEIKPDLIFSPHGNDTNRAHRTMYEIASSIAKTVNWPISLVLNRDAKTIDMRVDFYMPFDEEKAKWKRQLLRFHTSQQHRNLKVRGHGFDDRVLKINEATAKEMGINSPYAAAFEIQSYF